MPNNTPQSWVVTTKNTVAIYASIYLLLGMAVFCLLMINASLIPYLRYGIFVISIILISFMSYLFARLVRNASTDAYAWAHCFIMVLITLSAPVAMIMITNS